jgi:hypothetical protein
MVVIVKKKYLFSICHSFLIDINRENLDFFAFLTYKLGLVHIG